MRAREVVLESKNRGLFKRNDQRFAADFILMKLGVPLREGVLYTLPDLAEPSNARFLQRMLFFGLIDLLKNLPAVRALFSAEEWKIISRMAIFCTLFYGPYFLSTPVASQAATHDLDLIESLREYREQDPDIAEQALKVMDRHSDYLSPKLIPMILADKTLSEEVRQDFATVLHAKLEEGVWGGEEFEVGDTESPGPNMASGEIFWRNGRPSLSSFIGDTSFLIFRVINQQPDDLAWLAQPVAEWESSDSYLDFEYYVNNKHVVNDAAERAIGLVKPQVANFKKEENFQAAMKTIEVARAKFPNSKVRGVARRQMLKSDLKKIKPSELLPEEGEELDSSNSENDDSSGNDNSEESEGDPDIPEPPGVDPFDV